MATAFDFGEERKVIKERANQWLAQFAPLVFKHQPSEPQELHSQLETIQKLRSSESKLRYELGSLWEPSDQELRETFEKAALQLSPIEAEIRSRLSAISPGDPQGIVDIDALQERLAEREARQELGIENDPVPLILDEVTRKRNIPAGMTIGLFGLGWTSFTTLHCVLMIGGMMKSLGPIALFMLAFYSIFFLVGFAMLYAAFVSMCDESIKLEGRHLTITQKIFGYRRNKSHQLSPGSFAKIKKAKLVAKNSENPVNALWVTDINGKEIQIAIQTEEDFQKQKLEQINRYLQLRG